MSRSTESFVDFRLHAISLLEIITISSCVLINVLDGFDVLAMAFVAPSVVQEWKISPGAIGVLLSASILGMAIGSPFLAPLADRFGRRPVLLGSLILATLAMSGSAMARSMEELAIMRFATGLAVGAMLPVLTAMTAEFAPNKHRNLAIGAMTIGYSLGAVVGGWLAIVLIGNYGWRSVFVAGAVLSGALIPLVAMRMPESIDFLLTRRCARSLDRINAILNRLGTPPIKFHPPIVGKKSKAGPAALFSADQWGNSVLVCACFFLVMITFYFLLSWTPKLLVDLGVSNAIGVSGAVMMNLAGAIGGLLFGWLSSRRSLAWIGGDYMIACFAAVVLSSLMPPSLMWLMCITASIGFFMTGAVVACYALAARTFPSRLRATGTGIALGFGRLGGTLGPLIAGVLLSAGWTQYDVSVLLTIPMLVAAIAIKFVAVEH